MTPKNLPNLILFNGCIMTIDRLTATDCNAAARAKILHFMHNNLQDLGVATPQPPKSKGGKGEGKRLLDPPNQKSEITSL